MADIEKNRLAFEKWKGKKYLTLIKISININQNQNE